MLTRTVFIREADGELWEKAERFAGDGFPALLADALRDYVTAREREERARARQFTPVPPGPLLFKVAEVSKRLGVPRNRVYSWINRGLLLAVRDGKRLFVSARALDKFVEAIERGEWEDLVRGN